MSIAAVVNAGRRLIATAFLDSCAIADRVEVRDSRGGTRATWVNRHKTPPQVVSGGNGSTATVVARDDSGKILGTWVLPLSTLETIEDTGSVAPLGELTKQAAKEFTASLVGQGVVSVLPMKSLSGNITITGEFTKFATKRLTGGVAPAGGLRKVVSIHLHGAIGISGETRKAARIIRAGEIAVGGDALPVKQTTDIVLGGDMTIAGGFTKFATKRLTGGVTSAGVVNKAPRKLLAGTATSSGTVAKSPRKRLSGSSKPVGVVKRGPAKRFAGSVTPSGALFAERAPDVFTDFNSAVGGAPWPAPWSQVPRGDSIAEVRGGLGHLSADSTVGNYEWTGQVLIDGVPGPVEVMFDIRPNTNSRTHFLMVGSWDTGNAVDVIPSPYSDSVSNTWFKVLSNWSGPSYSTAGASGTGAWFTFRIRLEVGRLRLKRWATGSAEPGSWSLDITDANIAYATAAFVFIQESSVNALNSPDSRSLDVDNFKLWEL